jgi:2-keto-4-pentenoate hydratase/2-oxohepta-3-ene-1,7-dioic acid hydratase in catechol pathway
MRLARVRTNDGRAQFALSAGDDGWVPVETLGVTGRNTGEVITALRGVDTSSLDGSSNSIEDVEFLNPIVPPTKLLAIGLNYLDHIKENKVKEPENPILFAKFPNSLNDPDGRIIIDPRLTERGDYEVELTVVIGETTKGISEADALSCVFGYTVGNDVRRATGRGRTGSSTAPRASTPSARLGRGSRPPIRCRIPRAYHCDPG